MPRHRIALAASLSLFVISAFLPVAPRAGSPAAGSPTEFAATPAGPFVPSDVMKIDDRVTAPELLEKVTPVYPEDARSARAQGKVILQAVIDAEGRVTFVEVLNNTTGMLSLSEAASDAVRRWRYAPARFEGKPVPVYFTVVVNFFLESGPEDSFDSLGARDAILTLSAPASTLGEVLLFLSHETGLKFAFLSDVPRDAPVTVDWKEVTLRSALADLSARYPLTLQVLDLRTVAVSPKKSGA